MILQFDGTLPGFLTAVFQGYPYRRKLRFEVGFNLNFLPDTIRVDTEEDKARRVFNYLKKYFPFFVYREFKWAFLAEDPGILNDLGQTIYQMMDQGREVLYSAEESPRALRKNAKKLAGECHSYKGLLRFRELEGGVLYGPFRPKGDLIYPLAGHFKARLPKETFLLHDLGRNKAILYEDGDLQLVKVEEVAENLSDREEEIQDLWRAFTRSVSIGPRKNLKLQQSNMPKRYWEFLTEMQERRQ